MNAKTFNPGTGVIIAQKALSSGFSIWQGPLNTDGGGKLMLDARRGPGGYEVTVKEDGTYKVLGRFHVALFGDSKLKQEVKITPVKGCRVKFPTLQIWPGKTVATPEREARYCLRVQTLAAAATAASASNITGW
jgi:hypothetical protein